MSTWSIESAFIPRFLKTVPPGAEAPNRSIPIESDAYCDQPKVTPASTEITRGPSGQLLRSLNSQLGIETTFTGFVLAKSTQSETSEPVANKVASGFSCSTRR